MKDRILIASANRGHLAVSVERHIAKLHEADVVDSVDVYSLCHSPAFRGIDHVILGRILNNYERFIVPSLSGRDITSDLKIETRRIPPLPSSLQDLRQYELRGAKVGLATLSTVVGLTTIQRPITLKEYGRSLDRAWRSAHISLRIAEAVSGMGYRKVYIFNGRHCYARPICDVLGLKSEVIRYEKGFRSANTFISSPDPIHDPSVFARLIREHSFDPTEGERFYEERINRAAGNSASLFTRTQSVGMLPTGLNRTRFIAFFTSSTDEIYATKDDPSFGAFSSQASAVEELAKHCREAGVLLVVRFHPHLQYKSKSWEREWNLDHLERLGARVILPSDPSDSYALARRSHCVLTCGSTMSFESTYLAVPNATIGDSLAGALGASTVVRSLPEIAKFIGAPHLPDGARGGALMYGSFQKLGGEIVPGLDLREHPNCATLDGKLLDPIRCMIQEFRSLGSLVKNAMPRTRRGQA